VLSSFHWLTAVIDVLLRCGRVSLSHLTLSQNLNNHYNYVAGLVDEIALKVSSSSVQFPSYLSTPVIDLRRDGISRLPIHSKPSTDEDHQSVESPANCRGCHERVENNDRPDVGTSQGGLFERSDPI